MVDHQIPWKHGRPWSGFRLGSDIKLIWPLEELSETNRIVNVRPEHGWSAGHMTWKRSLIGPFRDTVDDVTRRAIFRWYRSQTKLGHTLSIGVVISLNCDRYEPRWTLGRTNVRCSCRSLSVSSLNPGNSCFWRTDRAFELARWSSEISRSRRNVTLAGTIRTGGQFIVKAGGLNISSISCVFGSGRAWKSSSGRDYII